MRRLLGLLLLLCFCLSGCHAPFSLPRAQEPRSTAIASVLGVENGVGDSIRIFAASQGRNGKMPLRYSGQSDSLSGALMDTRDQGEESVSYAHVEHIIMEVETAKIRLSQLLSFCFQNGEQSIESNLWLLRDADMETAFQGEADLAKRLSTLKTSGQEGTSLPPRSLRETAAQLADEGAMIIPALHFRDEELIFDSYALFQNGELIGYLEGDAARVTSILSGKAMYWTKQVSIGEQQEATVQLHSRGCTVRPVIEDGTLKKLKILCTVKGKLMEVWSGENEESLHTQVEEQVQKDLEETIALFQQWNADGANLRRQAGFPKFWNWSLLVEQWQDRFASLPCEVTVKAKLTEHF